MMEDFGGFLLMALILLFPLGFVYLILNLLNWNERKNNFIDSWVVYLSWFVSSLFGFIVSLITGEMFLRHQSEFVFFAVTISLVTFVNICAVATALYIRTRKKGTTDITNYLEEDITKPSVKNIWQTSVIVSILTLLFVVSLGMALKDIGEKWEKHKAPNKLSFRVYDI